MMNKQLLKNKRGNVGFLSMAGNVFKVLLIIAVLGIATMLALTTLNNSSIFTSGSLEDNLSTAVVQNISYGVGDFFGNTGTLMAILIAVVLIGFVALIIYVVHRFGGGRAQV